MYFYNIHYEVFQQQKTKLIFKQKKNPINYIKSHKVQFGLEDIP